MSPFASGFGPRPAPTPFTDIPSAPPFPVGGGFGNQADPGGQYVHPDRDALNAEKMQSINTGSPGPPASTDTVPAMLTPGEAVLNKPAAALAGRDNIQQLNDQGNWIDALRSRIRRKGPSTFGFGRGTSNVQGFKGAARA
jgi:hypothetical protein